MISASSSYGLNVLKQTSVGLQQGRAQALPIESLASLSRPLKGYRSSSATGENTDMLTTMASEKKSADSAEVLLQEVVQRIRSTREVVATGSGNSASNLASLKKDLTTTQDSLKDLEKQSQSSSSSRRLFTIVRQAVSDALGSASRAESLSSQQSVSALQQGERQVLSAITRTSNLSQDLEKASLNIVKVQKAYSGFEGTNSSSSWMSTINIDAVRAQQFSGLLLDIVR